MSGPIISAGWVGRVIDGRFALLDLLGGSGRSAVFATELQQAVAKRAALKLIATEGDEANAYLAGWAKAVNLTHPHLTRVYRSGRSQFGSIELVYVVTECADEILSQIIPERPLTTDETREMLMPVIDALEYLHAKGFAHGHLKPSNILVVDERVKISGDCVSMAGGARSRFEPLSVYEAPEMAKGIVTPASDIWAVGAIVVEALTQRAPMWDETSHREPYVPDGIPRVFAEIARGCLVRDPQRRMTLTELKRLLEPERPIEFPADKRVAEAAVPFSAETLEDTAEFSGAAPSSKRPIWLLVGGLVTILVLIAVLMMRSHPKSVAPQSATEATAPIASSTTTQSANSSRSGASHAGGVTRRTMPDVTASARKTIHGTVVVVVRVAVNEKGEVAQATLKSGGHSRYFANAAMKAAWSWKFEPPRRDGNASASTWTLRFKFRRSGDEVSAAEGRR